MMPSESVRARAALTLLALSTVLLPSILSCQRLHEEPLLPSGQTWAELRTVRRGVTVAPPKEAERAPYPRERIVDGEVIKVGSEGLAWLRRDGGATLLISGPASLTVRAGAIDVKEGRIFVDTPIGVTAELTTPSGPLHLAQVRASIDVHEGGATEAYVLAGEVRTDGSGRASAGERLVITGKPGEGKAVTSPALTWEDWTGGLATTDRAAEPSPYGVGTVGARKPGEQGAPRFPLSIQKLDVKVKIEQDFAITEVDEVFFNPSSDVVEGIYRFRTPDGATLHRFGVDRDGVIVWGRVKEKQAAAAQYQANVYQGSTEDPALLEWDAPGVYRARLYPIGPGEARRVVVRYAEWLGRTGPKGERRLYVYPMAAEGAEASLPHIEELYASIDLARAGAKDIRVGMAGVRDGDTLVVREHDFVPRADLAVELFDDSPRTPRGYTAPHVVDLQTLPSNERAEALQRAKSEADYILVPIPASGSASPASSPSPAASSAPAAPGAAPAAASGLDLAVVIDTSAATEASSLAIARAATAALLAHLGKQDRVVVWAGDAGLRPVVSGRDTLKPIDDAGRQEIMTRLAATQRGGATDLGAMLSQAAAALDPARRSAIVYIGDGSPTVGELALLDLQARLAKLPRPVRIFGLGVGDGADMAILKGLSRGAFAERIGDANAAARAALRLLEAAERPAWLGASVDLGPNVERVFPRDLGALVADSSLVVIGRLTGGGQPTSITLNTASGSEKIPLEVTAIDDKGDLRRRWAEGRLAQMMDENTGRAAMVDLGSRHGIITPVTSLYVPTKNEMTAEERSELERARLEDRDQRSRAMSSSPRRSHGEKEKSKGESDGTFWRGKKSEDMEAASVTADNKEGGTGTRAKGEEGSMGNPNSRSTQSRFGVAGPSARGDAAAARAEALRDAAEFGMIGLAATAAASAPGGGAPAAALPSTAPPAQAAPEAVAPPEPAKPAVARAPAALRPAAPPVGKPMEEKPADPDANKELSPLAQEITTEARKTAEEISKQDYADVPRDPSGVADQPWRDGEHDEGPAIGGFLGGKAGGGGGLAANQPVTGEGFGSGHGRLGGPAQREQSEAPVPERAADAKLKKSSGAKDKRGDTSVATGFRASISVAVGDVPHVALRCGSAAFVPFEERIQLWRERLAGAIGNPMSAATIYRRALFACEAPTFRERSKLLSLLLDAMPSVRAKVSLWRVLFRDLGAADMLYRSILARVRTPKEVRELHDALGLKSIDPGVLAKILKDAKTPLERANRLRGLFSEWPDDFTLALRLLDALEDAGDDAGARSLGNELRARPDADARLRTAVGELYLRLAARAASPEQKALDEGEARRAFGEIVEFAPDDPIARRRLGDLLRAHGLYADAARQYETLSRLAPDDASVPLLLAAAAEGRGLLEEAVKWTEKGGAAGAPDEGQSPARTARAFAATYLAWGRKAALDAGRADEAKTLAARLARVLSTERTSSDALRGTRVTLTWAHPEFHPTLWTNALGALMPAPEGDVTLGIAQAIMPTRDNAAIEVRVEPDELEHVARLGAAGTLTVVFDEGGSSEKIVKMPVKFGQKATLGFSVAGGAVQEVRP